MKITNEYDDYILYESLSNKLALRDFRLKYTEEEISKIAKKHNGYIGVEMHPFEKKYWDEFDKND